MSELRLRIYDARKSGDLRAALRGAPGYQDTGIDGVFDLRDPLSAELVEGLPDDAIARMRFRRTWGACFLFRAGEFARHCSEGVSP